MRFSELTLHTVKLPISYRGLTFSIEYLTERITPKYQKDLEKISEGDVDKHIGAQMLADLIATWDILDDDDQPIEVTYDFLLGFSNPLLTVFSNAILKDIAEAVNPTPKDSPNS